MCSPDTEGLQCLGPTLSLGGDAADRSIMPRGRRDGGESFVGASLCDRERACTRRLGESAGRGYRQRRPSMGVAVLC